MRQTFHLTSLEAWEAADPAVPLTAPSLTAEGFIHCTDGVDEMVATANRHYATIPGPFVVLTIDLDRCGSPWRIDAPGTPYPHVHGPIDRAAILAVTPIPRDPSGRFGRFEPLEPFVPTAAATRRP